MLSKKLISLVSAVLAMGILSGCNGASQNVSPTSSDGSQATSDSSTTDGGGSGGTVTHTVTFYDAGKVYGDPVTVNDGATVAKPATDPTKESDEFADYTFDNWYVTGATEAYDFATPVTQDLDLYSKYNSVVKEYDLAVFVYGVNAAKEPTTYITEEESNRVLSEFKKLDGVETTTKILWHYVEGLKNDDFNDAVNKSVIPVDLVISGAKINHSDNTVNIEVDSTYGKTSVGEGWFNNTTRYTAVTAACAENHKDLAIKLFEFVTKVGPDYEITLSSNNITIEVDGTEELTATYYGAAPTFELKELSPAGCFTFENGVITGVAAGTGKIVATDAASHTAECTVTVSGEPVVPAHDLVIAINISNASSKWMTEEDATALVDRFTSEGQPGAGKDVELHVIKGVAIQGVVDAIAAIKSEDELEKVDAIVCREAFTTNKTAKELLSTSYTPVTLHDTWKYDNGRFAIFKDAFDEHIALAEAFGTFVAAQNVDYFDWTPATLTVKVGATQQLETELTGLTYSSLNEDIATVTAAGFITGVAEGSTYIRIRKQAYYFDMALTVEPLVVQAVTLHFYVCTTATSTTYMTDDNVNLLKTYVNGKVPTTTTVEWHIVTGKTNAKLAELINGLEEDKADLVIGGSGAFGTDADTIGIHANMAKFKINNAFVKEKDDGTYEARYMAGVASMDASHVTAALQVYNLVKNYSAA